MSSKQSRMAEKLARIVSGNYRPQDFIIADAKDGDMGGGADAIGLEERSLNGLGNVQMDGEVQIARFTKISPSCLP